MQKRLFVLAIVFSIYFGVVFVDAGIEMVFFSDNYSGMAASVITKSHFKQPEESLLFSEYFTNFFSRVKEKDGGVLLSYSMQFYSILLVIYLILAAIIFTKLFSRTSYSEQKR